jgi:hypothetical protein
MQGASHQNRFAVRVVSHPTEQAIESAVPERSEDAQAYGARAGGGGQRQNRWGIEASLPYAL